MCKWFTNPCSLSQVFSEISAFLLPLNIGMLYCMFVDVWTPLEISLTTLRVILGVCLNKVIITELSNVYIIYSADLPFFLFQHKIIAAMLECNGSILNGVPVRMSDCDIVCFENVAEFVYIL